jgi:class 3 adenylate cyclase
MTLYEQLDRVVELLARRGRASYRALKREFELDDETLEDLKVELVDAQGVARDEGGQTLVWLGSAVAPPATGHQPALIPAPTAERRQVTVMFCDLVASTELAARLDPEELRDVLRAYQDVADQVIHALGGVIARYVGDGLLVYFGYPQAHEDDAQRAVRAGLRIIGAVRALHAQLAPRIAALRQTPLRVRIGVHTGLAVMGAIGNGSHRDEMAAVGETPSIAARIEGLAEPDTVVVSNTTRQLLRGAFLCEALGLRPLTGNAAPIALYTIVGEPDASAVADGVAGRLGLLVGREQEVGLLVERWAQATEGVGQVVLVSGEAGIGKSRLVQALKAHAGVEPHTELECRCLRHHEHSAFYPVRDVLRRALDIDASQSSTAQLAQLDEALRHNGGLPRDAGDLLAPLLAPAPAGAGGEAPSLNPERQRRRTLEVVVTLLLELAARQPVLLIVEDLLRVDPSTLEWLALLVEQAPTARLLVPLTARLDFHAPWTSHAHTAPLVLARLRRSQIERLILAVADGKALPPAVIEQAVTKTDGVPLFIEELTKMVLESGLVREAGDHYELAGPLPPLAIPATLQESLMARLDRLDTVKVVAQIGATIGRSFSYRLLHAVSGLDALSRA